MPFEDSQCGSAGPVLPLFAVEILIQIGKSQDCSPSSVARKVKQSFSFKRGREKMAQGEEERIQES